MTISSISITSYHKSRKAAVGISMAAKTNFLLIACYLKTAPPKTAILAQHGSITEKRSIASPIHGSKQWRPGVFRQGGGGGPAAKWRPFKSNIVIKSLNRLAAVAIFLIFLMVLFDTLTWSRAECRHLIDLGK